MVNEALVKDITIIGGGPVGMFSAFYAGLRGMSAQIIESLPQLGGQLSALYPEKYIYDIAGFPKVKAQELIGNLKQQMDNFPTDVFLGEVVEVVEKNDEGIFVIQTNKNMYYSKTILITAGNGAFNPRVLGLENEEKYKDKNIHYFINDLERFKGKSVTIFGGGDSAVDWALMLEPIAKNITLVHRRDKFRAHEHSVEQLMNSTINVVTPYIPKELIGSEHVEHVLLQHAKDESVTIVQEVDDIIVNFGFLSTLGPIKNWKLAIEKNSIVVNSKMETNIEGIYAAGDICTYDGKVKLIASGFGEAPVAISNAKVYVDPTSKVQPLHSTSIMAESNQTV
ncbi:NAD(P)/FAD-dependent oxidoreductase [Rummeliibacillus sp. NPDC094406]|uniref:NAD(P)/FAD-dependent oxidoreductase n=1 Tax=Rummeliibacillus sp. NPDC094406 TaxID=3364511 RepID=UPI00381CE56A